MANNAPNATITEDSNATVETTVAETRTRRPREKVRALDELKAIENVKSLSDKEKTILIEHYRAELNRVSAACNSYKANSEEAFRKARMLEDAYNQNIAMNNARLDDITQAVGTFYKTIYLMVKDGKKSND